MVHPNRNGRNKSNMEPQQPKTKKKVEWSSDLNSMELAPPDQRSPTWDTETDHLLSYFLGGDSNNHGLPSPPTQFATSGSAHSNNGYASAAGGGVQHRMPLPGGIPRPASIMAFDDDPGPPPTPATHYYYAGSTKPKQKPSSSSSSSSNTHSSLNDGDGNDSLMKARDSLLSGGLVGPAATTDSSQVGMSDGLSPISPAAMIGSAEHEPLMLPPSPDKGYCFPNRSNDATKRNSSHMAANHQSHLEWLQQINAMAKASICNTAPPMQPRVPSSHAPIPTTHHAAAAAAMPTTHASLPPTGAIHPGSTMPPAMSNPAVPPMAAHAIQQFSNGVGIPPHKAGDMLYTHLAQLQKAPASEAESEEKRARRLERNRESARKSRRRKKERLSHLGEKVATLHAKLAAARQKDINLMNTGLQNESYTMLSNLNVGDDTKDLEGKLRLWMHSTGPNCAVRRAVVDFQYSTLEQTLLPRYEKFLLWLTLHREEFYTKAKELHSKREGKHLVRSSFGKISSKQVGDELTNGKKLENGKTEPPAGQEKKGEKPNPTAQAFDSERMWPLFCYEVSVSVDQEDKFMQAYKRTRQSQSLSRDRSQIAAATRMASKLKEAVLYQSHTVAVRSEKSYVGTLTPQQTVLYQQWLSRNRERCREKLRQRRADITKYGAEQLCLMDVCKKLEEVLKISHETNTKTE